MFRLSDEMRAVVVSALALAVTCAAKAEDVSPPASGSGAVEISIHEDSTLTVSSDVVYESLAVTGSGKLTLAGAGRITTSSVAVSSGVVLVVNGRLDSTSITVASGGAADLVNSRDAHSLSIAGTGINDSGAAYCSESDVVDEDNSPFVTNITLTADATVKADYAWGIIAQNDDKAYLNLGTNKLTIKGTNSFLIARTEVYGSGAIEIDDGATLKPIKASPNSIFDATCTIKSGGKLDVAKTTTFKDLVCEEGGNISVSSGMYLNLCIRDQGTMTVRGTADVHGNLYLGTQYSHTANLEVGGVVNVHNGGKLDVCGSGYIKQIPGTQGKVNISNSGRVEYEHCATPWIAEYGDVFAGTGELKFETEEQITHTITNSDFAGVVKFSSSSYYDAYNVLGGSDGAMFSGAPELVSGGIIHFGEWYDAEGRVFCVRNLSGSGTFDADREATETPWTHTIETTQTTNSTFYGKFTGSTCRFDLVVNGTEELHTLTLAGESTTLGTLTITNNANVVFSTTGNWTNGTVVVAKGGYLESKNEGTVASALQLQSGSTLKIAAKTANGTTNAIPVAVGSLVLPQAGNATIDITDIPALESGESLLLVACTAITADTDVSHLQVAGKDGYSMKAEAGTGIAVEHVQEALVWSNGSWKVNSPEDMRRFSEATIVLAEGENVVELPVDVSFERVTVSAVAAASMCFSNHAATVGQLVLGENVTFVNNGLLNSAPVSVAANAVFEIAAPMTWTNTISGAGGVRVSADEVVFNKQNTFTGGLTVAPGGRARSNVGASLGGGGGGGYGGTATYDSNIRANRFYGNVTVESGGAADMIRNHYLSCYSLFLSGTGINGSGAAYRSGGISDAENQPHAMSITLLDDATVSADNAWGLVAPSYRATTLNLSDHTLTITGTNNFLLSNTTINGTGTIEIADGATLKTIRNNSASTSATCRIKSGGNFYVAEHATFSNVVCEAGSTMTFGYNKTLGAAGELVLPSDGYVTLDISAMPDISVGSTKTLIQCSSVTAGTDVSHLRVTGKENYLPKAVAGGIAVLRRPEALTWSDGSWNVDPEDMQGYSEATIVLSEGANVVELPGDVSFETVTVSAAAAATACFSNHTATVGQLVLGENVTFVNNDKLAAVAISMSSNSVFTVAQSTAYSGAISGEGAVTVADGGVLMVTNTTSVAATLQLQSGSTLKIAVNVENNVTNAIPVAVGSLVLPEDGSVTIDISDIPELEVGVARTLIACPTVAADADLSHLTVTGKMGCRLKVVEGAGIAVELRPDALVWADGSWNVAPEEMSLYSEAAIVLSAGTNTVTVPGSVAFDRITVTAAEDAKLFMTGCVATVANLILNTNVTFVAPHDWEVDTVLVDAGASISAESDAKVAENLVLVHGSTVYRGAHVVGATSLAVISNAANFEASPSRLPKMLFGSGKVNGVVIRNTTGQQPSGNFQVLNGRWSVTYSRPNPEVLILEPDAEPGSGAMTVTEEGASFSRASWTAPTGEVHSYESAQDAADAAEGKGGKVSVHASGESISLGAGWFSSGASIIVPAGVIGVTVSAAGVVLGGKDSGDDGSKEYEEEEEARAEVVETGKRYASLALAKSDMDNTPCTFRLLAESADSIHLASASDVSGQTLLLNNWPYAGTVTGAAANLSRAAAVTAYYAILADAKGDWTEGDTINLLSDGARYSVPAGKTLVLDGEKTYAVAKPFDLTGTLTVGGCTFTASAGININAGTLKAAKANCTLIRGGTEVTLREGGVKVDTDGYSAVIAATLTVAGGLQNAPVIFKAGLADLRLSGGVSGSSVITIQSGCGKVYAPTSSNCEPGDYTQISEQDAQWATFENGIAVARLVKADGSSTAYSSVNAAGAAAQLNPTYRYIEILVNNQTLRCLPTIGILRIKYNLDDIVLTFSVQSIAPDWTFDETYGVVYSVFTPVHKATDYVWDGGEDGEWESFGNWKCNLALDYDLPVATRAPDGNDTVTFRDDGMPVAGWSVRVGSSGGACKEIKVEEDARLTLSYGSLGCDINKTGAGAIVVTNAWTSGTPTITIEEDGGQVTLPKSAAYTLGTNTVVVSNAEDTVTLGFGVPIADPYAAWAAENGITGAWNEADRGGVYNVFRYLFDEPTGDIRIIDISFAAEGNVVITTPPVKNPEGFAVSVVETSDVEGKTVTDESEITDSSNTATFETTASSRFYRVKVVRDANP